MTTEQLTAECYCLEMNCGWRGELLALARCPECGSNQIRRVSENGEGARGKNQSMETERALATSGTWEWRATVVPFREGFTGSLSLSLYPENAHGVRLRVFETEGPSALKLERAIEREASRYGIALVWTESVSCPLTRFATQKVA